MAHQVYEPNDSLAPIDLSNYFELILLNKIMFRKHPYHLVKYCYIIQKECRNKFYLYVIGVKGTRPLREKRV